jgi:hypothetical protein
VCLTISRFRWVECQLTTLRSCKDPEDVDDALSELPEGLDDTYDRILNNIVREKDKKRAQYVFQLLAVSYRSLTVEEVTAAITVDCDREVPVVNPKKKMFNPYEILNICSSLVEISSGCVSIKCMNPDMT